MEKKTIQDYKDIINQKKWDAHNISWLYIDVNAKALLDEIEPKVSNITTCCKAMMEMMLEGDRFMELPRVKSRIGGALTVRYYCDNLSPQRRKYSEVENG